MVLPHPFMRYDCVKTVHEEIAAHFGVRITESAIDKNEWYWFNIHDDVKYIVANCQVLRPGHRELIAQDITIPVAELADDLPLDIIVQDDEHPVPHLLSRTLTPYLQWSACVEGAAERIPPSQQQYFDPRTTLDPAFFRYPTAEQFAAIREEEEEEESTGSDEGEDAREEGGDIDEVLGEEDKPPEEGSYSEHSEGEQSEEEEDEEEEEEHEEEPAGSEWEAVPEEALHTGTEAEDPEAARKREEFAAGKNLELASVANVMVIGAVDIVDVVDVIIAVADVIVVSTVAVVEAFVAL
ncbi:hypothetical protein CBR_g17108 [Chara braunii]|uniref:Uncharacterized protein n=1 Tax=Chara braunii TaxID=69332 RepID=A0A388KUT8_CHABU|nr:hypothetical protein CBR_g17108 [Chara braunii]|eukprot:GBG73768.1 hypothetical protein CBR_g17108 [Chara braunii]